MDNSRASNLLLTFRDLQSAIKCSRWRAVLHIQRWNADPTDGLFPENFLSGIIPTHLNFLYKVNGDITSPFSQVFRFQRYHTLELSILSLRYKIFQLFFFLEIFFETSSLRYHRLSYILVSANLHFLKHIPFSSADLLGHSFLLFFVYRIQSFHSRFF